jgi:predicted enzyme related to lactoylglutathione lyase
MVTSRTKTWARPVVFFEIQAQDPERTSAFYREMFEWNIAPGAVPGFLSIEHGIGAPEDGIGGVITPAGDSSRIAVFVQVADLRASLALAEELGGSVVMQPLDVPNGPTVARIKDPEGNLVGLVQQ